MHTVSRLFGLHRIYHPNFLMPSQISLFFVGYELKEAELEEVATVSGVLNVSDDSRSKIEVSNICATGWRHQK